MRTDLDSILTTEKIKNNTLRPLDEVGAVTKTDGTDGEVLVKLAPGTDADEIFDADHLLVRVAGGVVPMRINSVTRRGDRAATVSLAHIDSARQAEFIVGCKVCAEPDEDYEEEEDTIVGYELIDVNAGPVGVIDDIDDTVAANPLFVVTRPDGSEILIPAADELIRGVDDDQRTVTMDVPAGLIDAADAISEDD